MPEWLCLKNGMLNIKTLELVPHDPGFMRLLNFLLNTIPNPKASASYGWFLETNIQTPEVIAQVQKFFGYCLYRRTHITKVLASARTGV